MDAHTSYAGILSAPCSPAQSEPLDDFLFQVSPRDKPWDDHRLQADQVTSILADGLPHHQRQAERMRECAKRLNFGWVIDSIETGETRLRLKKAQFCRVRHCPICQWRRAKMWVARFYHAFPKIYADHPDLRYILLTLTVRNCPVLKLRETIREMNSAWKRLTERKIWPALGFVRSLEITRAKDGAAHPHYHCLLAVPPSYFNGRKYLSTAKWAHLWQEALRIDYTPICDVRLVKPKPWEKLRQTSPLGLQEVLMDEVRNAIITPETFNEGGGREFYDADFEALRPTPVEVLLSSITEVIKYAVKPSDMVADPDWLLTLTDELRNARAVAIGGIFRKYLSDEEPQNLVAENEDEISKNPGGVLFGWREQYNRYKRERHA